MIRTACAYCSDDRTLVNGRCACGLRYVEIPEGRQQVKITVSAGPDSNGNHAFTADWVEIGTGRVRGQCFRAKLLEHVASWQKRAADVAVEGAI